MGQRKRGMYEFLSATCTCTGINIYRFQVVSFNLQELRGQINYGATYPYWCAKLATNTTISQVRISLIEHGKIYQIEREELYEHM